MAVLGEESVAVPAVPQVGAFLVQRRQVLRLGREPWIMRPAPLDRALGPAVFRGVKRSMLLRDSALTTLPVTSSAW